MLILLKYYLKSSAGGSWLLSYQDQSGEQEEEYEMEEQLQTRILTSALEFVPLYGWSMEAIAAGAEVC